MIPQPSGSFIESLQRAPAFKRQSMLLDQISQIVQDIRQVQLSRPLQADQRLLALGLPSLQLIELKVRLEQLFAVEVPVTLFFEHVTLDRLTNYLVSELLGLDTGLPNAAPEQSLDRGITSRAEEVAQLSDAEAEAQLLRHIANVARTLEP